MKEETLKSGIYVHIPYCRKKCLYCDFYSGGSRIARWEEYSEALLKELRKRKDEIKGVPSTLYFGGGTPSLMPGEIFKRLVRGIIELTGQRAWEEFTLEVNPEDVTPEKTGIWKEMGVNRVSLGVQTLEDEELKAIGRLHNGETAIEAVKMLKEVFDNISIDVIYGLPGQTTETYRKTLQRILDLRPHHISSYSLMLEEGTSMTVLAEKGKIELPDEEEWLEMSGITIKMLEAEGYNRYEVSNYSLSGKESRHNNLYWSGNPYLGLGVAAHSYDGSKIRRYNPADLKGYIEFYGRQGKETENAEGKTFYTEELLDEDELREEMIMTRLRTNRGLNLKEFEKSFGKDTKKELLENARRFIESGCLRKQGDYLSYTPKGYLISNVILRALI